jgi:ATP-binding cassette subfamily F protein uup
VTVNGQPRHVLGYLADFLFPRERARSPVKALSGGERNRLLLARLFAQPANVLVLDEPTNDLDIETLELLEELLDDFDGTVLLVTHDREFLDNIVTSTLAFDGSGRIVEYVGGWQDYLRQSAAESQSRRVQGDPPYVARTAGGAPLDPSGNRSNEGVPRRSSGGADPGSPRRSSGGADPGSPRRSSGGAKAGRKKTFREEREYAALPARIELLEGEQRRLQEEASGTEFYKTSADHIASVLARIDAIHVELEEALARWIELEAIGQ